MSIDFAQCVFLVVQIIAAKNFILLLGSMHILCIFKNIIPGLEIYGKENYIVCHSIIILMHIAMI